MITAHTYFHESNIKNIRKFEKTTLFAEFLSQFHHSETIQQQRFE